MKIKTVLVGAAIGLLGASAAMAQVYSVNAVGYVNVTVPPKEVGSGFTFISNPLKAGTNTLAALLSNVPVNSFLYYNRGGLRLAKFAPEDEDPSIISWGTDAGLVFLPGEGFLLQNPTSSSYVITFVGEVSQGNLTNQVPIGFSMQASQVPQSGGLQSTLGYRPTVGDNVYKFEAGNYRLYKYQNNDEDPTIQEWSPSEPNISVAEGFWIDGEDSKTWGRSFSVN